MPATHYPFSRIYRTDGTIIYEFITDYLKGYSVYFTQSAIDLNQCFDSPSICEFGYVFGFMGFEGEKRKDDAIFPTLKRIIEDFYQENGDDKVLVFTCDTADERQQCREKLFSTWLSSDDCVGYLWDFIEVYDEVSNKTYYHGYLFKSNHPKSENIKKEFDGFADSLLIKG